MMTPVETLPGIEFFGDATPFVGRIHEIIEAIRLFDDFEMQEIEILARYMRSYRAFPGTEIILKAMMATSCCCCLMDVQK